MNYRSPTQFPSFCAAVRRLLLAAALAAAASSATAEEVIDSIAAVVNNDIILESEVSYGVSTLLLEEGVRFPTDEDLERLRSQVLDAFIMQKVLLARAAEETLAVEDRVVDRELDRRMQTLIAQVGGEEKLVEYFNKPLRMIRREMRKGVREGLLVEILRNRYVSDIYVRRQEVIKFYNERKGELPSLPERVELSHILLEVQPSPQAERIAWEKINAADSLLKAGADFDSLAPVWSEDASAPQAGRLGFTSRGDLIPEFEEVAYALKPGEVSDPVQTRFGLHIIRLVDRQGERISTQHILVKLAPTADDKVRYLDLAKALVDSLQSGEAFARIAAAYSDDENSSAKGGYLGYLEVTNLPSELKETIELMSEGEIAGPVETPFGIQLLRLESRIPSKTASLEEDWQTIEQYALNAKRQAAFSEWLEELKHDHYIRR